MSSEDDWSFLDEWQYHCGLNDNVKTLEQFVKFVKDGKLPAGFESELVNDRNPYSVNDLVMPKGQEQVTALHCACAAGCLDNAKYLKDELHATVATNASGNTPLHWAAQNGHADVTQWLLQAYPELDVLQRNNFGRSALALAFESQNEECVQAVLNHDSAAELVPDDERDDDKMEMEEFRKEAQ
ncbi:ankyrin repeat protein [Gregarina niphandrodes]|uniref:Ankyrin repeat protein n=1 Tax=Gregarina niphandrodes TaxID=110365 RepID=A0A023B531_GRENI|nr:ankyrin repeat protein [Gregarina niphandrodes]EZG58466.1 ankyrin repeat protein [Gregarina niphandrodes]|eukprot:XP_011130965.1 ankyrin repeat protein [Gregarina niphandrodes]